VRKFGLANQSGVDGALTFNLVSSPHQQSYTPRWFTFLGYILLKSIALPIALLSVVATATADEGQWQRHQLPQLKAELKRIGITTRLKN